MKTLLFLVLMLPTFALAADSPFDGTWKIDLDTAQFPDKPIRLELQKGTYQNFTSMPKITVKADGSDQLVPGARDYDTLAVKTVDDRTVELTAKKESKVVWSEKGIVSAGGKILTFDYTEYPAASKQPVTGKVTYIRTTASPPGSHAVSGSWRIQKVNASENSLTATFKCTADGLAYSSSIGESFEAKFDGKDYPMKGIPAGYTVSVTKVNDRSLISTLKRDGKIVMVYHQTVLPDGKTQSIKVENKEQGTTTIYTSIKQ